MPLVITDPATPDELVDNDPLNTGDMLGAPRRQRAPRANGASTSATVAHLRPKPPKARTGRKGAKPTSRSPRTPPPSLDDRIRAYEEAGGRCCVTGRRLNPLAYGRDWDVADGELVSTAALKVKGEGKHAKSWDDLRAVLKARLDAARALEGEFGHLYPPGKDSVTLHMGGAAPPPDDEELQ